MVRGAVSVSEPMACSDDQYIFILDSDSKEGYGSRVEETGGI